MGVLASKCLKEFACEAICALKSLSRVRPFETRWTAAHQAPLRMGLYRQEYWSGWPFPSGPGLSGFWAYIHIIWLCWVLAKA